jgi:ubiquinone/menaquinone biosynthesis C-methylase UbiE
VTYWLDHDPPNSFIPEGYSYEAKRTFRYNLIPYLPAAARFDQFAGKRVLCVGEGSGIDAVEFARHGAHVSAVDISPKAIALVTKHFDEAGLPLDWSAVANAESLPMPPAFFDHVYMFGVLHHIEDAPAAVREIARVLKPGGTFAGMVYHKDSLLYAYSILARGQRAGLDPDAAMRAWSERNPGCPYSISYTRGELTELLTAHGFEGIDAEIHYPVIDLPERRKVPFAIEGAGDLGWHLFFRGTRA